MMTPEQRALIQKAFLEADLPWTTDMVARYAGYLDALLEARARFNLVGTGNPVELVEDHIADSLLALPYLLHAGSIVDVGSGAGFPGIPLAIARPGCRFLLVESRDRRAQFLADTATALPLPNVRVESERAETLARRPEFREVHDAAVARATAPLNRLLEITLPFVRVGGRLVAHKGAEPEAEVEEAARALAELGGRVERVIPTESPRRTALVIVEKVQPTPGRYPRNPGQVQKRPL